MNPEILKKASEYVDNEIDLDLIEDEDYDKMPENPHDSFGEFYLTGHCEPEDAIWRRDLQSNFYTGLEIGIRNTLKFIKENPELVKDL